MAKYNLENYTAADGLGFPLNFRRGNPNPLDNSSVWASLEAAQNYAATDATAYVGQILSIVDNTNGVVTVYSIQDEAGTLKKVGTSPVGDEATIAVAEDGTVSLYGIDGLALTRTEEDGSTTNITYQPLYVNGKLTWVEPSATTVEGLATEIEGLKTRISALETTVGNAEGGLVKDVADNAAAIETLDGKIGEDNVATQINNAITKLKLPETYEAIGAAAAAKGEIEAVIGEVTEGKTVVQMISDAQTAATYDDTELAGRVKAIEDDYLVEADKTELSTAITDGVEEAKTYADGLNTTMANRVKAIEDDYLTSDDKEALTNSIAAAEESAVDRVLGYLAEDVVNEKYDTLKEVAAWIESDTTNSAELINRVSAIEDDYLKGADKIELQDAIDDLEAFVGALPEDAASTTVVAYIQEAIDGLKIGDYAKAADLTELANRVTALENKMTAVEEDIGEINTALDGKVDIVEGSRLMTDAEGTKLEGIEDGAQANKIETVSAEFSLEDKHLSIAAIEQAKVTGLVDTLAGKVDKVEGSRLMTTAEADKLEKLVLGEDGSVEVSGTIAAGNVDGLDAWITARAGTLEGLSENNFTDALLTKLEGIATGAQVNVIDGVSGEFTISADGKVLNIAAVGMGKVTGLNDALAGKVDAVDGMGLSHNDLTDELVAKINASQANVLESVSVAGTLLNIVDKGVNIPVATADAHGVVKSSADENKVAVAEDGTMEVNSLNVNKLVQTGGEYLIMNGGSAAI